MKIEEIIVTSSNAEKQPYVFLSKGPGVVVIALDETTDRLFFIREFRHPIAQNIWQLPAGSLQKKSIASESKKELYEETGIVAKKIKRIGGFFIAPGHENSYVHVVLATNLDTSALSISFQESNETITKVVEVELDEVRRMIRKGELKCGISLAALSIFFSRG
ncbi:MAG: NUDIX hydrolase [Candidatus Komeilibacteria bacterium]|nr:NUDIX hydrolase [Candidatus Komeilibacteria bacterium]